MRFMVCIIHSCGQAATTNEIVVAACLFETYRGCYQNKIQDRASRWFYYTIGNKRYALEGHIEVTPSNLVFYIFLS